MSKKTPQQLREEALNKAYDLVQANAQFVWDQLEKDIEVPKAILTFNGNDLVYGSSIIMIQGKEGTHKSRLAGALATLLLSENTEQVLLGFKKTTADHNTVVYLDTERNKTHQLPMMLKQVFKDCNLEKEELKKRFILSPISEVNRKDRSYIMGKIFMRLPEREKKTIVVIVDIVSDFVMDFNDLSGTNEFLDLMHSSTSTRDITYIVVIHENPGMTDKARGHLGTELANKAATILKIGTTTVPDVFELQIKKSRTTAKPPSLLLKFDPEANTLVPVSGEQSGLTQLELDISKICNVLSSPPFLSITRKELLERICTSLKWQERKAEKLLKKIVEEKIVFDSGFGDATMEKSRGKSAVYTVKMTEPDSPNGEERDKSPENTDSRMTKDTDNGEQDVSNDETKSE